MSYDPPPLSKTAKYKKITKPLLERKRRARINRCLDELKDLMVGALEIDDENLSKLEKADILELTVNHLQKLHSPKDPVIEAKKFHAGFGQCATEACKFIMSMPDLDKNVSRNLVSHLSGLISPQPLTIQVPERPHYSPQHSPSSILSDRNNYYSDHNSSPSDVEEYVYYGDRRRGRSIEQQPIMRNAAPMTGLLTTVDQIDHHQLREQSYSPNSNASYFHKVPAEAKDAILKKIRQHIMDKRGNDINGTEQMNVTESLKVEPKYMHQEVFRNELPYPYSVLNLPANSETLDLRKVRTPSKISPKSQVDTPSQAETASRTTSVIMEQKEPEKCELPKDYSNLPPKKKRKLIEYQESKKQEEAKRQYEIIYGLKRESRDAEGPPMEAGPDDNWRPW